MSRASSLLTDDFFCLVDLLRSRRLNHLDAERRYLLEIDERDR